MASLASPVGCRPSCQVTWDAGICTPWVVHSFCSKLILAEICMENPFCSLTSLLPHTLKNNIAAEKHESWYFSTEPVQTQIGKEEKKVNTVQGKVVVSDNSLTGSFCAVSILIQTKPQFVRDTIPPKRNTAKHSMMMREGTNLTISPQAEVLKSFFPQRRNKLLVSMLKCVLLCSCLCCCCASTSAVVGASHGVKLCCAEPWLGLGSGCTWCLWGPSQNHDVCTNTNQGSKEATVQT